MENTFEKYLAPVKELNELTLKNIEKIAALQVKAIQESAKISIDAIQASTEVKDIDSLKSYLQNQVAVAQTVSNHAVKDADKIAKLTESYVNNVKSVVEKAVFAA